MLFIQKTKVFTQCSIYVYICIYGVSENEVCYMQNATNIRMSCCTRLHFAVHKPTHFPEYSYPQSSAQQKIHHISHNLS